MIGIDLTRISRFEQMNLDRLSRHLGHCLTDAQTAAKVWACWEAIIKAEGHSVPVEDLEFVFVTNSAPVVKDPHKVLSGPYAVSISHEQDWVIAVAINLKAINETKHL